MFILLLASQNVHSFSAHIAEIFHWWCAQLNRFIQTVSEMMQMYNCSIFGQIRNVENFDNNTCLPNLFISLFETILFYSSRNWLYKIIHKYFLTLSCKITFKFKIHMYSFAVMSQKLAIYILRLIHNKVQCLILFISLLTKPNGHSLNFC